jgi:hypothetical protein
MTLRVVMSDSASGSCEGSEIMVSALCTTPVAAAANTNGASCTGDGAKVRLVCAKR